MADTTNTNERRKSVSFAVIFPKIIFEAHKTRSMITFNAIDAYQSIPLYTLCNTPIPRGAKSGFPGAFWGGPGGGPGGAQNPPYRPLFKSKSENRCGRSLEHDTPTINASNIRFPGGSKNCLRGVPCANKRVFRPQNRAFLAIFGDFRVLAQIGPFWPFLAPFGPPWPGPPRPPKLA